MRITANEHYITKNGSLAHVEKFYPGDASQAAYFFGAIAERGLAQWRSDGVSAEHSDFDIVRRATKDDIAAYRQKVGLDKGT